MIYTANTHWKYALFLNGRRLYGAFYVDTKKRIIRLMKMEDQYNKQGQVLVRKDKRTGRSKGPIIQTWHVPRGSIRMVKE